MIRRLIDALRRRRRHDPNDPRENWPRRSAMAAAYDREIDKRGADHRATHGDDVTGGVRFIG